ncbi:unnamed protein product [Chrysoparadoxa australica]
MPCSGDPMILCGAGLRNSVYEIPPPPLTNGPNFLGCFIDNGARKDLEYSAYSGPENSPEFCGALCREQGYTFFGLQYGAECCCGNEYGSYGPADDPSECSMPCSGDPTIRCGAGMRNSVYEIPLPPPTAAPTPAPAAPMEDMSYIGCYMDTAGARDIANREYVGDLNSPTYCGILCGSLGYSIAGLQYSVECYCDDSFGASGAAPNERDCNMPCSGSPSETCGGPSRNSVYVLDPSMIASDPVCGDGNCAGEETCRNCPIDCPCENLGTDEYCMSLVPENDITHGRAAVFTGCTFVPGCYTPFIPSQAGCQTCIWDPTSVAAFHQNLQICEDLAPGVNIEQLVVDVFGYLPPTVKLADVSNNELCDPGEATRGQLNRPYNWFYHQESNTCYAKGFIFKIEEAVGICAQIGANVWAPRSAAQESFVQDNMLWNGFGGETYTGIQRDGRQTPFRTYSWSVVTATEQGFANLPAPPLNPAEDMSNWLARGWLQLDPISLDFDYSNFLIGSSIGNVPGERSCAEIEPTRTASGDKKFWNPFSCDVNKWVICEKPPGPQRRALGESSNKGARLRGGFEVSSTGDVTPATSDEN